MILYVTLLFIGVFQHYNENWIKRFESVIDNMNDTIFDKIGKKFKRNYDAGMNVYLLGRDLIEVGLFQEYKKGVI